MIKPQGRQRISKEDMYLNSAENFAYRSTCLKRKYGAVIVKDDAVISTGYNGSPRGFEKLLRYWGMSPDAAEHAPGRGLWNVPCHSCRGQCAAELLKRADTGSRPVSYQYQPGG